MKDVKARIRNGAENLRLYWTQPPHSRYMPFKEIASLAVGGMGVKFICYAVQLMILSVGNTLIGNTIGIPPRELYIIYILSVLFGFPLTALRAKIIDNSGNRKGKFRPYIFTMAIPTVILAIGFTYMPYDSMTMLWKCVTVLLYNIGFQFFYMFMFDSYTNIINVLSPNTYERSDVNSVTAVFLALFDADTLQLLAPTMRISHVIMTVSRVLAITAGAVGIFAGVYFSRLSDFCALKKPMCIGAAAAVVCSVFANAENLQTVLYAACGVLLLIGCLLSDFAEPAPTVQASPSRPKTVCGVLSDFLGTTALVVLFGISYSVWRENAGFGETGLTVILGCICILLVASARTRPNLLQAAALLLGSAVSYCLVHFASEVITYSANRVIYVLPYWIFAICFAVYLGSLLLRLPARKNKPQNGNG